MENRSYRYEILTIEGMRITYYSTYPVFVLLLLTYLFIMVCNLGIIVMIAMEKALHKPMYLLFCNLPVNDVLSATVILPGLLKNLLLESDRYISFVACAIQAFCVHTLGTSALTVLLIMAFDRYMAICDPLRYHTVMTNKMVVKLSVIAWVSASLPVVVVIALSVRLSHCTSIISNPYCDNPSLFKLSCENVLVNNVFGLFITVSFWTISLLCISFTYIKIACVCLKNRNSAVKMKAVKTCSTHLIVYLIFLGCSCTIIILHRFSNYVELRHLASVVITIIPPSLNPVIYGLQTKEIRHWIDKIVLRTKVIPG